MANGAPLTPLAARLLRAIQAAGVAIDDVVIGSETDRPTWRVVPASLQGAAQPTINSVDLTAAAVVNADLDATVTAILDNERLMSAVVWTILDTYSPPATIAKYQIARTKIIAAYKAQPWKP